jgi:hypothetical protein
MTRCHDERSHSQEKAPVQWSRCDLTHKLFHSRSIQTEGSNLRALKFEAAVIFGKFVRFWDCPPPDQTARSETGLKKRSFVNGALKEIPSPICETIAQCDLTVLG